MDVIDEANEHAEMLRLRALAAQREQRNANVESEKFCIDCGIDIPEIRQKAIPGVQRCVDCQEDYERRKKRGL